MLSWHSTILCPAEGGGDAGGNEYSGTPAAERLLVNRRKVVVLGSWLGAVMEPSLLRSAIDIASMAW